MLLRRDIPLRSVKILLCVLALHFASFQVYAQRTSLDVAFQNIYRPFRLFGLQFAGRSSENRNNREIVRDLGKTQNVNTRARSLLKFCDTENGPGSRNDTRPTSVHRLKPGDIDIIGAMGDSLTAGNGIFATTLPHVTVENKGMVWSIGGQSNWKQYLTLPNILKEFNPNLYGYSLRDSISTDRSSKFNVAELGAMSRDIPYEAKVLVKRMKRDPRVNMASDWKLVTLLISNNDFCSDVCYYPNPEDTIKWHENNMLKTYRYLRDNVPRLMVNVVPPPNLVFLTKLTGLPPQCRISLPFECPCLVSKPKSQVKYIDGLMRRWIAKDEEIVNRDEFNSETFTINYQPFTQFEDFFRKSDGTSDTRFLSDDCFHLSQKGHAVAANAYWNNLFEAPGKKSALFPVLFEKFECPTEERPYIVTRVNSKPDFKV